MRRVVPWRRRLAISLALGLVAAGVTVQKNLESAWPRDFGQVWFAARCVLQGIDPYPLVGPHLAYDWPWPLLYPIPAAIASIPFAPLSLPWASVAFSFIGGACFAWALLEHGYAPAFGFFSGAVHMAAETVQWSPLLASSIVIPPLAFLLIAKPTIGAALFIARPTWWALGGAICLSAVAWVVQPTWVADWRAAIALNTQVWGGQASHTAPVLYPGGVVALLALLRWRRPEARLVAALACVPQSTVQYEAVPLFLVPRTFGETWVLWACSYAQLFLGRYFVHAAPTAAEHLKISGRWLALVMYVPATIMVLRRPNEGAVPAWRWRAVARA